ncbi:hypothetical protein [Teredinibacter haidensis]|uniref:hypothetical protein n=1 Tax=Teredinibacter haidensis TaxID=2731755 RepID=UPI00094894E4|nr:hypothetical protein [Teredinibacter haidensis]
MSNLELNLKNHKTDEGAYALVVFDESSSMAIKVFKNDPNITQHANVFNSEVEAYEKAAQDEELKVLVPVFYGKVEINKILDKADNDISSNYFLNLAYGMSIEDKEFIKLYSAGVCEKERTRIVELFNKNGIMYTRDSSVLMKKSKIVKVIDFAIQAHETSWE